MLAFPGILYKLADSHAKSGPTQVFRCLEVAKAPDTGGVSKLVN